MLTAPDWIATVRAGSPVAFQRSDECNNIVRRAGLHANDAPHALDCRGASGALRRSRVASACLA